MANAKDDKKKAGKKKNNSLKPDPETLQTTDPQDKMKGPLSSAVQGVKEASEGDESKESADKRKEENM